MKQKRAAILLLVFYWKTERPFVENTANSVFSTNGL